MNLSTSQHLHFSPEDGDIMFLRNVHTASQPESNIYVFTAVRTSNLAFLHLSIFFSRMTRTWQPRMRRAYGALTSNRASRRPWQSIRPVAAGRLSCRTKARCTVSIVLRPCGFVVHTVVVSTHFFSVQRLSTET
jgi:hypothetical protein